MYTITCKITLKKVKRESSVNNMTFYFFYVANAAYKTIKPIK